MQIVKVGGVPEHFNMPWHYASEQNLFAQRNIGISWVDYSTGTGAMMQDINDGKLDLAVVLTEGATAAICNGANAKIVQWYTTSPLNWGIHVSAFSEIESETDIFNKRYAVSRFGSGSHLMAHVHASNFGTTLNDSQFIIVNSLRGAETSLTDKAADIFFWEKYTTQPSIDKGLFKRIGEAPTPWPCFVVVANNDFITNNKALLFDTLVGINQVTKTFKNLSDVVAMIAQKYNLNKEQVKEWLETVNWNYEIKIDGSVIDHISMQMLSLGLIKNRKDTNSIIYKF